MVRKQFVIIIIKRNLLSTTLGFHSPSSGLTSDDVVLDGTLALVADDDAVPQPVGDHVTTHQGAAPTANVHSSPLVAADVVVCNQPTVQLFNQSQLLQFYVTR